MVHDMPRPFVDVGQPRHTSTGATSWASRWAKAVGIGVARPSMWMTRPPLLLTMKKPTALKRVNHLRSPRLRNGDLLRTHTAERAFGSCSSVICPSLHRSKRTGGTSSANPQLTAYAVAV